MDEEINIIQKRIMDLIGKIQDEFTNGSSNVVRAAENMNEALAFEKKREAGREINSELHNLFIRRDELLTKSEGYTHTIFSKHNFEKLKEDAENKCFNNYTSPFINFLTKDEKNATEFRSIYEKGIHFAVERLASYGWYINYLFKPLDIIQAATYTNNLDSKKLDEFMFQMIESNLVSIKETLTNRHKKREKIFDALFKAHFQKEYYLSIPVIFTQCDGISKDATNYIFFKNSSKKFGYSPIITDWANN